MIFRDVPFDQFLRHGRPGDRVVYFHGSLSVLRDKVAMDLRQREGKRGKRGKRAMCDAAELACCAVADVAYGKAMDGRGHLFQKRVAKGWDYYYEKRRD
jgi:hypothetical protein